MRSDAHLSQKGGQEKGGQDMESEGRQEKALEGKEEVFPPRHRLDEAGIGGHSKRADCSSTGGDRGGLSSVPFSSYFRQRKAYRPVVSKPWLAGPLSMALPQQNTTCGFPQTV